MSTAFYNFQRVALKRYRFLSYLFRHLAGHPFNRHAFIPGTMHVPVHGKDIANEVKLKNLEIGDGAVYSGGPAHNHSLKELGGRCVADKSIGWG